MLRHLQPSTITTVSVGVVAVIVGAVAAYIARRSVKAKARKPAPDQPVRRMHARVRDHNSRSSFWPTRALSVLLVAAPATLAGLSIEHLFTERTPSSATVAEATLGAIATALSLVFAQRTWKEGKEWHVKPYWVGDRPAVRFETGAGDYIKFERYDDGVSANWSTSDGPQVLLSIPLRGKAKAAMAQFWTMASESKERRLADIAHDLLLSKSDIIRAWVETDRELIVWRLADAGSAGIAQLGVLMSSWNPSRVAQLVSVSATDPVQSAVSERLENAFPWVGNSKNNFG